jgi:hypothetical protein
MPTPIPETRKIPGVAYASTPSGLELAILDITHPAFRLRQDADALAEEALALAQKRAAAGLAGRLFNRWVLPHILKRSRIGQGLLAAHGSHLDGLSTYLMKLGAPALAGPAFKALDRSIAGSAVARLLRLRVIDLAQAQARCLAPLLHAAGGRPLHLLNIAGGPASDSLNTLLLLHRVRPALLGPRPITVHLLDLDQAGPQFAAQALTAWQGPGGPLEGLHAALHVQPYDWAQVRGLEAILATLPADALLLAGSEGGLFDYGTDAQILSNLRVLHAGSPADAQVCGTLTLSAGPGQLLRQGTVASVIARDLAPFAALAAEAGWRLDEQWQGPTSAGFRLVKA